MGKDIRDRDRKDSLSSDDSLSRSDSLSSSDDNRDNRDKKQSNNRKRSSSDSLSSDDRNKSKKDRRDKDSKDSKKDKKKDDKKKKSKKKISKDDKKDKKKKSKSGKDKDKKSKKVKKEKKSKKESKKETKSSTVKKNKFGKYGIISKEHIYEKRDEFQQWLADVKKMNIEVLGQNEEKRLFDDFIEDYNTASMPEKKYYDLVLWEQYNNSKEMGKHGRRNEDIALDDEAIKNLERERQRKAYEASATADALNQIYTSGNMVSEIQETQAKTAMMQHNYKIGDIEKALDIQKELVPEKKKPGQQ